MIHPNTEHAVQQVISTCVTNKEYFVAGLFEACLTLLRAGRELEVTQAVSRLAEEHGQAPASTRRGAHAPAAKKTARGPRKRHVSEETRRKLSELAKKNWQARRAAAAKKAAGKGPRKKTAVAKKAAPKAPSAAA